MSQKEREPMVTADPDGSSSSSRSGDPMNPNTWVSSLLIMVFVILQATGSLVLNTCDAFQFTTHSEHEHVLIRQLFILLQYVLAVAMLLFLQVTIQLHEGCPERPQYRWAWLGRLVGWSRGRLKPTQHPNGDRQEIEWHVRGMNLYMRLGTAGFGFGVIAHDGLKLSSEFMGREFCNGPVWQMKHAIHALFVLYQTFFIFKYHRVIININRWPIRLALAHLSVVNFCEWIRVVITEIQQDIMQGEGNATAAAVGCNVNRFQDITYLLYPVNIEYCLVVGLLFFKIMNRITTPAKDLSHRNPYRFNGASEQPRGSRKQSAELCRAHALAPPTCCLSCQGCEDDEDGEGLGRENRQAEFSQSHGGLFLGIIVFAAVIVSLGFFSKFIKRSSESAHDRALHIYHGSKIAVIFVSFCATVVSACQLRRLQYRHIKTESDFEYVLLMVGFIGGAIYHMFLFIPAVESFSELGRHSLSGHYVTLSFSTTVQSAFQYVLIKYGSRRGACCLAQKRQKPGRSALTFLLVCNLSIWLLNTFEVRRVDHDLNLHRQYFGLTAWKIITCALLPLIIFFRFHSTVCLADMWTSCYLLEQEYK